MRRRSAIGDAAYWVNKGWWPVMRLLASVNRFATLWRI